MEIDFQTSDHVVAMDKVADQHISTKCSIYASFQVIRNLLTVVGIEKSERSHYSLSYWNRLASYSPGVMIQK